MVGLRLRQENHEATAITKAQVLRLYTVFSCRSMGICCSLSPTEAVQAAALGTRDKNETSIRGCAVTRLAAAKPRFQFSLCLS